MAANGFAWQPRAGGEGEGRDGPAQFVGNMVVQVDIGADRKLVQIVGVGRDDRAIDVSGKKVAGEQSPDFIQAAQAIAGGDSGHGPVRQAADIGWRRRGALDAEAGQAVAQLGQQLGNGDGHHPGLVRRHERGGDVDALVALDQPAFLEQGADLTPHGFARNAQRKGQLVWPDRPAHFVRGRGVQSAIGRRQLRLSVDIADIGVTDRQEDEALDNVLIEQAGQEADIVKHELGRQPDDGPSTHGSCPL